MDDNKVAVLLEDLKAQFRLFGEGMQLMNDKIDKVDRKVDQIEQELLHFKAGNYQEHQQIIEAVKDLDGAVKRLDTEVVQIKRVK